MTPLKLVQIGEVDHKLYLLYSDGSLWARELDDDWEEQILPNVKSKIVQFCEVNEFLHIRLSNGAIWKRLADTSWLHLTKPA